MKRTIVISLATFLIGVIGGWFLFEYRTGLNLFDCWVLQTKIGLHTGTELVEIINTGQPKGLEQEVVSQLREMVDIIGKREDKLCTRIEAKLCQEVLAELEAARKALAFYETTSNQSLRSAQ